jgi:hypothetical protein
MSMGETWTNNVKPRRPIDLAALFATTSPILSGFGALPAALSSFADGRVTESLAAINRIRPVEFDRARDYLAWAQLMGLFSKSSLKGRDDELREVAWKKFQAAERSCKRANKRLAYYYARPERENPIYRVVLSRAKELISKVLGTYTESTLEHILDLSRPGSGSAIGVRSREEISWPDKFDQKTSLCVTPDALPYARLLLEESRCWIESAGGEQAIRYCVTPLNRVAFVRKDAKQDRTIAVEPHLNVCLQQGAARYIAMRLKSFGVDISDQTRNQKLARQGSLDWNSSDPLVTLDLSAASDSICISLVKRLLPWVWSEFLDDLRSKGYAHKGAAYTYQKWSSMGNGYTFPLETLLFWGLASACSSLCVGPDTVSVYGDDIIVSRSSAALLIEVLKYCGFSTNVDKSFIFGPFRESCGADWWDGERVTPVYLRGMQRIRPTDIYRLVNTCPKGIGESGLISACLALLSPAEKLWGPVDHDNAAGHLWTSEVFGEISKRSRRIHARQYYTAVFVPTRKRVRDEAAYSAALCGALNLTDNRYAKTVIRGKGRWTLSKRFWS